MICIACNTSNGDRARFCNACGSELQSEITQQAPLPRQRTAPNSAADPLIGTTIAGKYHIHLKLGSGGMGAVYRATRPLIGDEVAIKILHFDQKDPKAGERFRREAQASARLKHANAVSIHDFGITYEGRQYLVMELVEGETLRQIIKQQGPLTPSASAEIINQVCAALDEAHRQNIIHRDIKPDNILVNLTANRLQVKVLDFGIAKLRDDTAGNLTQTGSVLGTPHYMSPEQCLGEELDSRSDIYSLGIVLYEMLTGIVPFNSPISTAVVVQHVNQPPPSLRARNAAIPQSVEIAVLHALEKKRESRPYTAGVLAAELRTAVANASFPGAECISEPTVVLNRESHNQFQGSSLSLGIPPSKPSSRRKTVSVTILVTLVLVVVGVLGFRTLFRVRGESAGSVTPNPAQTQPAPASVGQPHNLTRTETQTTGPPPVDTSLLTSEVQAVLQAWSGAARAHDLDLQMTHYADTVSPYFGRRNVNKAEIQADRLIAYRRYSKLVVQLSNIRIAFDQSGTRATASFDKYFAFEGEKHFSGSVNTKLWLTKFGSRWLITGEKDQKVHYVDNNKIDN